MGFQSLVAGRYLRGAQGSEDGRRFLQFVTVVAVGGVAVAVAALLMALAVVRGFSQEIEAKIIGFGAHIQVENIRHAPLNGGEELQTRIAEHSEVVAYQPVVSEFVLLRRSRTDVAGVSLWGTDSLPSYLSGQVSAGTGVLSPGEATLPRLVIGSALAQSLRLEVGDTVLLLSTRNLQGTSPSRPRVRQFEIGGLYTTSLADFDETHAFTDIGTARALLDYGPDQLTRVDVTVQEVARAYAVARDLEEALGLQVLARTIYELYRGLFAWVDLQEAIIPLVIGMLMLVAAFNMMGTLLMVVLEKTREIGILASMGASRRLIQALYIRLGVLIGGTGTAIGLALALGLGLAQQRYGLIRLPAEAYYMSTAPVALAPGDFIGVAVASLLLCVASSYFPARFASRLDPLQVIRFS